MNNRKTHESDYRQIKRKTIFKIVWIAVLAFAATTVDRFLYSNWILNEYIDKFFSMYLNFSLPRNNTNIFAWDGMRPNLDYLIYAVLAVIVFFLARSLILQFGRYYREINYGIDTLAGDTDGEINLSPDMESIENKLRAIKRTIGMREREAELAERRKNELVMYLAHDIKTPLTSVIGYLSLLDEAPDMPVGQKAKYVNITLEKAYRLERLIDEFFEITRYNFQAGRLSRKNIDLYFMLAQMADEFYPLLSAAGKQIKLDIPEDMTVYGDPDRLARVFNNILRNAVSYGEGDGVIEIWAIASGRMVSIMFKNPGGIPEDRLATIFDKFFRLDSARQSGTGGAGLGLAIAKEIVDEHGGRIYADSDGASTTFTVELPANQNSF